MHTLYASVSGDDGTLGALPDLVLLGQVDVCLGARLVRDRARHAVQQLVVEGRRKRDGRWEHCWRPVGVAEQVPHAMQALCPQSHATSAKGAGGKVVLHIHVESYQGHAQAIPPPS